MTLKKKLKIFFSLAVLAVFLFAALPKVYIHALLGHIHHSKTSKTEVSVTENNDTQDCNFEKFNTPVYYSVFKFILNFSPLKGSKETSFNYHELSVPKFQYNTSFIKPPRREFVFKIE